MVLKQWLIGVCLLAIALTCSGTLARAGTIGFPVARLEPWHLRFELAGDSFTEKLKNDVDAEGETGRALLTTAFGLTSWSEVYVRLGMAEFQVDEALFNGDFGFAYGGGVRLRLFSFPLGSLGVSAQYLRFTSDDDNSAGESVSGEWEEVDLTVGIGTKRFGAFQFYVGGAFHYSDIVLDADDSGESDKFETETPFRLLLGTHIYPLLDFPGGDFVINIETRVIGEIPQFTLGVQYAF